jgi:hypothetical protein
VWKTQSHSPNPHGILLLHTMCGVILGLSGNFFFNCEAEISKRFLEGFTRIQT